MGFIANLKNIFKPKETKPDLVHPIFGNMIAEICGDEDDFWQSEITFTPLNIDICVNVRAGEEGPSHEQVTFYNDFLSNYKKHFELVSNSIMNEATNWLQNPIKGSFNETFSFVGITIPKEGNPKNNWELSFDCLSDKDGHMFTAEIQNGVVVSVRADG